MRNNIKEILNKIKEIANKILNSKAFIIVIGICLFIKTMYFYSDTIYPSGHFGKETIEGTVEFIIVLCCFLSIIPNKARIITSLIIDSLISILLWADNLYYTYSSNVLSVIQMSNIQYTEEILQTLPALMNFTQILYFIDIIAILILLISKTIKIDKTKNIKSGYSSNWSVYILFNGL